MTDWDQPELFDGAGSNLKPWQGGDRIARDVAEGMRQRDEALARVTEHANDSYKEQFDEVVWQYVKNRQRFSSEDVTAVIGMPPNGSPNVVGALTRACATRYHYMKVDRVKATRTNQHASEIAVWGPKE